MSELQPEPHVLLKFIHALIDGVAWMVSFAYPATEEQVAFWMFVVCVAVGTFCFTYIICDEIRKYKKRKQTGAS